MGGEGSDESRKVKVACLQRDTPSRWLGTLWQRHQVVMEGFCKGREAMEMGKRWKLKQMSSSLRLTYDKALSHF